MPAQNFLSCATINQRLLVESGRIGPDAYTRGREESPIWLGMIEQKPWEDNMGQIVSNTIYQRSGLTTPPTWTNMAASNGSSINGCYPPLVTISNSATTQQFQRAWIALESDPLCLEDLRISHDPKRALSAFQDNLMGNANYVRKERNRSEYERLAYHKVVVAPGLPEDHTAFPLVQPTSPMTMGVLRTYYAQLLREADGTSGVNKVAVNDRGATQFIYVASMETIENMVKTDADIRNDFRWSTRANELLGSYSSKFSYGGFVLWEDSFPPRYNWSGADFVRVPEYVASATTVGNKLEINPAWTGAQYEVSYIFHPDVMISRVPSPNVSYGDVAYKAQNYALEFRWINKWDRNCNPDENIGFFRAVGEHASEPVFVQFGYAFLSLRCSQSLNLVPCGSNSGYNSSGIAGGAYSGPDSVIS